MMGRSMYVAEILPTKETYSNEDWQRLVLALAKHIGGIQPMTVCVTFFENQVKFYIESKKDISNLTGSLDGFMLLPAEPGETLQIPPGAKKKGFLKIPAGGNVLDLKDRYHLKDGKQLTLIRIKVRKVGYQFPCTLYAVMGIGQESSVNKQHLTLFPGHLLALNIAESQNYIFASMPSYISLEKTLHLLQTSNNNAVFSVPGFPYATKDYYLPLSAYQFDKHSLIVGASGSGKSKLIQLLIDRIEQYGNAKEVYRVVVIDPHAALEAELGHVDKSRIINLGEESAQLFPDADADISAATELTTTLFQSLLADQYNPRLERVLRFSVYVMLTAQIMSLDHLKQFLTDLDMRMQVLQHVEGFVPQNIQQFFATDFNELRTQHYTEAILPIASLVDEMQLQPSLVGEASVSLAKTVQDNFLTVFSLNKVSMGEKAVKTVAGLLIQQIFLLAQARALPYKLILIIDEVSIVQNPALAAILAEARKFNLSVILTQQYFSQVEQSIKDAILSNVVNYYVFRVSEEDAKQLEGNMVIELPTEVVERGRAKGLTESHMKIKLLTDQSVRQCIVRISANGQLLPAIKAITVGVDELAGASVKIAAEHSRPRLQKLPEKMALQSNEQVIDSRAAVDLMIGSEPEKIVADESTNDLKSIDARSQPPAIINIQQILADQSSSRADSRKVL